MLNRVGATLHAELDGFTRTCVHGKSGPERVRLVGNCFHLLEGVIGVPDVLLVLSRIATTRVEALDPVIAIPHALSDPHAKCPWSIGVVSVRTLHQGRNAHVGL